VHFPLHLFLLLCNMTKRGRVKWWSDALCCTLA
jgi:hypothetical protein